MKRLTLALLLALAAGCNGSKPDSPVAPAASFVTLKSHKVEVAHLVRDPDRRYPRGAGILCSWDRDRFVHFFSSDSPELCDVIFLDSAGRVIEVEKLAGFSEAGITSKSEVRHALFLSAGAIRNDGLEPGGTVTFSPLIAATKPAAMPVVTVGGHKVHVETSHTLSQRQRGLMHRPRLSKDDGMLFLYPQAGERSFWMMNTLIALDIAYFDGDGRLLNVARMKAAADPSQGGDLKAPSAGAARFVLEVNYGWFDARGLIDADGKPKAPVKLELPAEVRKLADDAE
ncbi:MAG TPA: DUF192 domain-containing protein [Planctomycetota bacterium]|nr:DUF192 domain-containing protein [Planctomycetota bacterium]